MEIYNLFNGRSKLIPPEDPESIYFMDKFMQANHLYMHREGGYENIPVVMYQAFRSPVFVPMRVKSEIESGLFKIN